MVINKNTANRVKNYCKAIEQGIDRKKLPQSAYTYSELKGSTPYEKMLFWSEIQYAFGTNKPTRKNVREYNKRYLELGNSYSERMERITLNKICLTKVA